MSAKKSSIDTSLIRELAELLKETDLNEIEVMEGDLSIRLARGGGEVTYAAPVQMAAPAPVAAAAQPAPTADKPVVASGTEVPSPMVGTAYHSPSPDADVFVKIGQSVKKGDTIMIVEAMKTMNQIPSPADGTVAEICIDDGQPVEYGEALIILA